MTDIYPEESWEKLRKPFDIEEIELLPKYTGKKIDGKIPKDAYRKCSECGGYHPFPCVHLNYVGHAQITDRLNDVDPEWNWEPCAFDQFGQPLIHNGGMWIKLTVLGVTRYGYGDAQGKAGHDATKEIIGDAIRNAAMRFGVASYLWSKSERAKQRLIEGSQDNESSVIETTKDTSLEAAKRRLWAAEKKYAEVHSLDPKAIHEGVRKRPDYEESSEFFNLVAEEFESAQ